MNRSESDGFEGDLPPVTGQRVKREIINRNTATVTRVHEHDV